MSLQDEQSNKVNILTGTSIPAILPKHYFAIFYDGEFKGVMLSQLGNSDTYVALPAKVKDILKYYWSKIRGN